MRLPLRRWQLFVLALLIGTLRDPAAHAGVILAPGDIVAGGGKNVVRIDPNSGAQTLIGQGSGPILGLEVDPIGRVVALIDPDRIVRINPRFFDAGNPLANQETVWLRGDNNPACGQAFGFERSNDGTLFVACAINVIQVDPNQYDPQQPGSNQKVVAQGDPGDGLFGVAIDPVLGSLYGVTFQGFVERIDPEAFNPSDPSANQATVGYTGDNNYSTPTIEIDANRMLWIGESFQAANSVVVHIDPSAYDQAHVDANRTFLHPILPTPGDQIISLYGIAIDANGKLVASEQNAQRVLRIDPTSYDPQTEQVSAVIVSSGNLLLGSDYGERAVAVVPEADGGLLAALCVLGAMRVRPHLRPVQGPAA